MKLRRWVDILWDTWAWLWLVHDALLLSDLLCSTSPRQQCPVSIPFIQRGNLVCNSGCGSIFPSADPQVLRTNKIHPDYVDSLRETMREWLLSAGLQYCLSVFGYNFITLMFLFLFCSTWQARAKRLMWEGQGLYHSVILYLKTLQDMKFNVQSASQISYPHMDLVRELIFQTVEIENGVVWVRLADKQA